MAEVQRFRHRRGLQPANLGRSEIGVGAGGSEWWIDCNSSEALPGAIDQWNHSQDLVHRLINFGHPWGPGHRGPIGKYATGAGRGKSATPEPTESTKTSSEPRNEHLEGRIQLGSKGLQLARRFTQAPHRNAAQFWNHRDVELALNLDLGCQDPKRQAGIWTFEVKRDYHPGAER